MEQHRVSAPPSAPAATVQRSKAPAQARAAEGAEDDPATTAAFSSLLSALGDDATEEALQPATSLLSNAAPLVPELNPLAHGAQPAGGLVAAGSAPGADAWKPLQGVAAQGAGVATLSLADAAQRAGLLGAELLDQGGLVAQTAKIDAAAELPLAPGQGGAVAGYQRAFARLQTVLSQGSQVGAGLAAQALGQQPAGAHRQGALASQAAPTASAVLHEGQRVAATAAAHAPNEVAASPLLAQWLAAEPGARSVAAPITTEYKVGAHALSGSAPGAQGESRLDGGPTASDVPGAGADEAVTEQASYWVSENLQNAELTVTHEGMPVEVSVSLSGKEAHVAFRSDESQTRDLLDASQDQLRDMLGSEGLVLSGVSVGESGARQTSGEGAASQRGRASGRVGVQVPVSEAATHASRRAHVVTDSAVDVFV